MVPAIGNRNLSKIEWIDTFKTADVVREKIWVRTALMVCIDTAHFAEVVPCRASVELIQG